MAKVWKAYIKKHGEIPENETDLMVFSRKCRTVQTLTEKQALKIYNKKMKAQHSKKKKKDKRKQKQSRSEKSNTNTTKRTKKKNKTEKKSKTDTKNSKKKNQKSLKTDKKPSKHSKEREREKKKKTNKDINATKNISPSKYHRRRTSTNEHIKSANAKRKKTNRKSTQPLPEVLPEQQEPQPQTQHTHNTSSLNHSETDVVIVSDLIVSEEYPDNSKPETENDFQVLVDPDDEKEEEDLSSGVSAKSPGLGSALAMFEKLSSFEESDIKPPVSKVKKKGKRYFDFREFANGAFSIVYKAKDKENNDDIVAIKKIHIGGSLYDGQYEPTTKEEGDNEVRILKLMNGHCNTCNLMDTYFDMELGVNSGYVLCIVMEYVQYTLKERIEYYGDKGDCIPFDLIKMYAFQICKAINYLHIKNVLHRDIKPENILVNARTNSVQLCDFGCSLVMGLNEYNNDEEYKYEDERADGNEPYVMSRFYRAPECILGDRYYDCTADIWSYGVVIGEMFLGMILFMGSSNKDQLREIILKLGWPSKQQLMDMNPNLKQFDEIDGIYGLDEENALGESWNMIFCGVFDMEEEAIDFISKLLVYSPKKRLSLLQCLAHDYFDDIKDLVKKSNKKKGKKEDNVPSDLLHWNDIEIKYAKAKNVTLPM